MTPRHRLVAVVVVAVAVSFIPAEETRPVSIAEPKTADGFVPLFNGKNLDGWVNVNCHPSTFYVKDSTIITTGQPTGFLRTVRQYENFVLEMDWMHVNKTEVGNSGLFVWGDPLPAVGTPYTRGIEVQVLVNLEYKDKQGRVTASSHGDVFAIWGATCKPDRPHPSGAMRCIPSEYRAKGGGEWNHYKVTAQDGVIKLEVNGKEVSGVSACRPRKGYLALESEGAECHFRNIKIKELPSSHPKPEDIAEEWAGHVSIFNGLDLKGWKTEKDAWKVRGGKLVAAGTADLTYDHIPVNGAILFFDWKVPAKSVAKLELDVAGTATSLTAEKPGAWQRSQVRLAPKAEGSFVTFKPLEGLEIMNVFLKALPPK